MPNVSPPAEDVAAGRTPDGRADENRGMTFPLPGPLVYDPRRCCLWDGRTMAADLSPLRGWLTSENGLQMTEAEAAAYQERVGGRMESAWNSHDRLLAALRLIADIAEGSIPANSLPNISRIARAALKAIGGQP